MSPRDSKTNERQGTGSGGGEVIELRKRVDAHDSKLDEQDSKLREVDTLTGRYMSTDAAVTAITNQIGILRAEQKRGFAKITKQLARAQAMPLAVLAFLMCNVNNVSVGTTMGTSLAVCVVSFFFPELASKFAHRAQEGVRGALGGEGASIPPKDGGAAAEKE